jgi:putative transposase
LTRVLAQIEVTFSNSMIEAFWRSLKHSWLYLHSLDSFAAIHRLIELDVKAHNEVMPHSAFQGQPPDEVFFSIGDEVTKKLAVARKAARENRMKENRAVGCGVCTEETSSGALLLRRARSRMS